jgi:hypothetical protein
MSDVLGGYKETAAYMRMSVSWLEHSDVPRSHLGRRVVFLKSVVDAYIVARLSHRMAS